jgi:hypothetical protein
MLACPVAERLTTQQIQYRDVNRTGLERGVSEKFFECVPDDLIGSTVRIFQRGRTRPGCTAEMMPARPPNGQVRKAFVEN